MRPRIAAAMSRDCEMAMTDDSVGLGVHFGFETWGVFGISGQHCAACPSLQCLNLGVLFDGHRTE